MDPEAPGRKGNPPGAHRSGTHRLWGGSWYFDVASADASAGAFVRVGDYPHLGARWSWAYVAAGPRTIGCAVSTPVPEGRSAPWETSDASLHLRLDPGRDGWHISADGNGFGLDLAWRPVAPEYAYTRGNRYEQPGWAVGEVSADGTSYRVDGPGQRDHSYGVRDWWRLGWTWCAGWFADGSRFQATVLEARGRIAPDGYLIPPGSPPEPVVAAEVATDALRLNDIRLVFADVAAVTVELRSPTGELGFLHRAMARVRTGDGRPGIAWRERNVPHGHRSRFQVPAPRVPA